FHLFEQAPAIKGIGAGFGLAANAMQALSYLGLSDEIKKIGFQVNSYAILDQQGRVLVDPNTATLSQRYQQENYILHRADLHQHLFSKINPAQISLAAKGTHVKQNSDHVLVYFEDGRIHKCKYLLVTDGIKSALRMQLIPNSTPRYAGYTCWRATIDNSKIQLDKGTETWGNKGRFGMSPLINNRIYWYACINAKANSLKYKGFTRQDLIDNFSNYHQPITDILQETQNEDLIWNDILDIKPLKRFAFRHILLMGDA
ncbi:MAG: FAD-dependent monooxygenase, partial [Sphingobacterium sp.]